MSAVVADTHTVYWYLLKPDMLSDAARTALIGAVSSGDSIYVATISLVEIRYLVEKGRLPREALERLDKVLDDENGDLEAAPLDRGVAKALERIPRGVVPDMPDRIIAATALHLSVPLVTRDAAIQAAPIVTIW